MITRKGPTILLVDDEEDIREAISFDLERNGFEVLTADGGNAAIATLEKFRVDLVITDLYMPAGNGMDLLDRVRTRFPRLPVFMFVSDGHGHSLEMAQKKGANLIFSKPFCRKELLSAIVKSLQRGRETG